ncbi:MAG: threonine--tRNA ligase [Thermoplasmata archaeon]|nr:threonine--tRNA ligase [Euryarchaeota archaeon]RLF64065.1 MAG: threonine--tRNA ligase [Thermoplasmata archaeon]
MYANASFGVISLRLLFIHTDYIEFETKEPVKGIAEEISDELKHLKVPEALAVFVSVEEDDVSNKESIIEDAVKNILEIFEKVNAERIVLYPYVHLTNRPSPSKDAKSILIEIFEKLKEKGLEVYRAPFGWYKAFELRCKGHPLSELSRTITPRPKTREEVVAEITSEYYIIHPNGIVEKIEDLEKMDLSAINDHALRSYIESEELGKVKKGTPPSVDAMRRLELVDYEPASDPGNMRIYPKGAILFNVLVSWAKKIALEDLKAMEIITPLIYDWNEPDIREQAESFHERHYIVKTPDEKKKLVLRFAADFGLFKMMKDATLSYKNLPIRIFEFARSFRYEKSGEISGLKRVRSFHMPDLHSFCADVEQGWEEFATLFSHYKRLTDATGIEYAIVFRAAKEWWNRLKDKVIELVKESGKPAFIEVLSKMKHYWAIKSEFQAIDSMGGNVQLATVQLDVIDAARYGIYYTDANGQRKGCIIVHSSIGSIERWIYAVLEEALKKEKPEIPFWLSPIQVRFIPVNDSYVKDCIRLASSLRARADVDDRDISVARKIRDAEREWVNMIIVYGEKEKLTGVLPVRFRDGHIEHMSFEDLKKRVEELMGEYPFVPLYLPMRISLRPKFVG